MRGSSSSFTGTVPLSTEELQRRRNKEKEQRRILRIQQVREQEKKYALRLLEANKRQKKSQQEQVLSEVKDEWETQKQENIAKLQQKIDYAISKVGAAQADAYQLAQAQAREATQAYEHLLEAKAEEAKRYDDAYQWLQLSISERRAPKQRVLESRSQAMKVEKERAKGKVAQMKAKQVEMAQKEKENIVEEPKGPQVLNFKAHSSTRVHYKATRFHETAHNEIPETPAKNPPPQPTPRDSIYMLQENAFTTAITMEQEGIMKAERDREEAERRNTLLQQRTKIAHARLVAEKEGKEAEKALAQHVQETRKQKAHQIGEVSRVVERRVVNGDNPVIDTRLDSQYSQEDGTLGLSWSCMSRERVKKSSRSEKLNRAFEEQFLTNAPQPAEHPDDASADLDIFSNFKDLHSPHSVSPPAPLATPKSNISTASRPSAHSMTANTSNASSYNTISSTTAASVPTPTHKPTIVSDPPKPPSRISPKDAHQPRPPSNTSLSQKSDSSSSFTLPPPLAVHSAHTTQTDITDIQQPVHSEETSNDTFSLTNEANPHWYLLHPDNDSLSHYLEPTPPEAGNTERKQESLQEEEDQQSNSTQFPPLNFSYGLASEEYLKDFERKMRELDEHFHKALGLPPSPSPSLNLSSGTPSSIQSSHLPSPYQPYQPSYQSPYQSQVDYDQPTPRQPSPQQSSPHQSSPLPSAYPSPHNSSNASIPSPQSATSYQSTPLNMPTTQAHHAHIQDSHFQAIFKPTPHTRPTNTDTRYPSPPPNDYPVFTFVLDSPTRNQPRSPSPRAASPYSNDEDIFVVSPLSSSPSPSRSRSPTRSPARSPFLSNSPLSNHSLSYSTDSLFMSL